MVYSLEGLFGVKGQVITVTGGTRGIGRELAEALSQLGAHVAVIGTKQDACEQVAGQLSQNGAEAFGIAADVSDFQSVEHAYQAIRQHFGTIDAVVNSAGINRIEQLDTQSMEDFDLVTSVNYLGTVHSCKAALPHLLEAGGGHIVNISSLSAFDGKPRYTAYSGSKAAIHGFSRALAAEWARQNINVNVVSPGLVITDINRKDFEEHPDAFQQRLQMIPRGCAGTLEWLVSPVISLLSPGAAHITGQVLCVDGGLSTCDMFVLKK